VQLCSVRRSLIGNALPTLVHAFIACRVDYCNALLYGVHRRLQSVLHAAAARLITAIRPSDHITSTLPDTLHWLPIIQRRVTFKLRWWHSTVSDHGRCQKYLRDVCTRWRHDHDCGLLITPTLSSPAHWQLAAAAAASALPDPQLGTVFPRTFLVRAPGRSSNVASRAGRLSERTTGGASEILFVWRRALQICLILLLRVYYYYYYYLYYRCF